MRLWEIRRINGEAVILPSKPSKPIYCPICGGDLMLHDFSCRYQARILKWELKEIYKDKQDKFEERLRRWGYW